MRIVFSTINRVLRAVAGIEIGRSGQTAQNDILKVQLKESADAREVVAAQFAAAVEQRNAAYAEIEASRRKLLRFGAGPYPDSLYEQMFPAGSVDGKRFYNIGSGDWRHPYWTNVDYDSSYYSYPSALIDINWDISKLEPLPVESGSAELVYSSHTVEHLQDHHVAHVLAEAYRILKPGGVLRITTPNAELTYWATLRRDGDVARHFTYECSFFDMKSSYTRERLPIWFVNEFASQLVQGVGEGRLNGQYVEQPEAIQAVLDVLPMTGALDHFTSRADFDLHRQAPGHHVSWWTNDKMRDAMRRAGFKHVVISVAGGSVSPVMRNREFFDTKLATYSIFVEAIKD